MTIQDKNNNIDFGVPLNRFSLEKCKKIHAASLELLDRVGARLHMEEAIQLLKKAGAKVIASNLVRIPSHLVENALATAPKKIDLFDRHARPAINLGYLKSGLTFSFSHLVICDEIVNWIKAFTKDVKVTEETLALDVIEEVGP